MDKRDEQSQILSTKILLIVIKRCIFHFDMYKQ